MSKPTEEYDFLFEYVLNFLNSPLWTSPLNAFVDEFCVIFDNEAESTHDQQDVHEAYRILIEDLLKSHLSTVGVNEEQFAQACAQGALNGHHKHVFATIMAADDFVAFKTLMSRRNVALDEAAKAELRKRGLASLSTTDENSYQYDLAIKLSKQEYEDTQRRLKQEEDMINLALKLSAEEAESARKLCERREQEEHDKRMAEQLKLHMLEEAALTARTPCATATRPMTMDYKHDDEPEELIPVSSSAVQLTEQKCEEKAFDNVVPERNINGLSLPDSRTLPVIPVSSASRVSHLPRLPSINTNTTASHTTGRAIEEAVQQRDVRAQRTAIVAARKHRGDDDLREYNKTNGSHEPDAKADDTSNVLLQKLRDGIRGREKRLAEEEALHQRRRNEYQQAEADENASRKRQQEAAQEEMRRRAALKKEEEARLLAELQKRGALDSAQSEFSF